MLNYLYSRILCCQNLIVEFVEFVNSIFCGMMLASRTSRLARIGRIIAALIKDQTWMPVATRVKCKTYSGVKLEC